MKQKKKANSSSILKKTESFHARALLPDESKTANAIQKMKSASVTRIQT